MRINEHDKQALIELLSEYLTASIGAELRLFGSRADDSAKGGDIDLLLILPDALLQEKLAQQKFMILAKLKEKIGEQKIDLIITTNEKIAASAFLQTVHPDSVLIHRW